MESNEDDKDDSGIVDGIISNIGDEEVSLGIILYISSCTVLDFCDV